MTEIGSGGIRIRKIFFPQQFKRDRRKLEPQLARRLDAKLRDLLRDPMPPGLRFEKLKGYNKPALYSFHVTGNYKVSLEIQGDTAILRRVGNHDEIDRRP